MPIAIQTLPNARALSRQLWLTAATVLLAAGALWLTSGSAQAQPAKPDAQPKAQAQAQGSGSKLSAADETALRSYTLTPETVDRALAVAQDARRDKVSGNTGKDAKSLDGWAAGLSAEPKAKALLDKHQIPARDYVMTMIALMRANYAVSADVKKPEEVGTNAANIAYFKAHKDHVMNGLRGGSKGGDKAEVKPADKASAAEKAK